MWTQDLCLSCCRQISGLHTVIRNRNTPRDEFIFYSKRLIRLVSLGSRIRTQDQWSDGWLSATYDLAQGTHTLILKGKYPYGWPPHPCWLGLCCFEIGEKCFIQRCSWFLTSKDKEVSHTDTSPFWIKVSLPWARSCRTLNLPSGH